MPILEVEITTSNGDILAPGLAQSIADSAGAVLGTPPGRTCVKLRALSREHYAESNSIVPDDVYPVFVTLLKSRIGTADERKTEANRLCGAIAKACNRPKENVHILYLPEAAGRMSFGGELVPV